MSNESHLSGLKPGTTYHYRLVATNNSGPGYGSDVSFKTNNPPIGSGFDFNGDGKTDILWRHKTLGMNCVWYLDGATQTGGDYILRQGDMDWKMIGK